MIPLLIAVAALLALYLLFFLENCRFRTTYTVCRHKKIASHFRVVQVSDLHDRSFGDRQYKLIEAIQSANPDYIFITGDLFNRHKPDACENALLFIRRAARIAPIYFIEGNHECSLGRTGERYIKKLSKMGVHVLQDAYVDLPQCRLIGLRQRAPQDTLAAMLHTDRFRIVLSHRPERFPIYAETDADVILSGHAHGGQVRLGHIGIYAPQQGLFPKYTEGWYQIGESRMYVSRGLGNTIGFPRVFNTPELNVIDFDPQEEE